MTTGPIKPNLFLAGAPKSGTTAMSHYLRSHPQVYFSDLKEPFFFADDLPGLRRRDGVTTLTRYLKLFQGATREHQAVGEGSTLYLFSECAAQRILQFQPGAKIVVMLRHPAELAHAFHMQMRFHFLEDEEDFETAWHLQQERRGNRRIPRRCIEPQLLQYRRVASLGEQIDRLLRTVPPRQVLTIFFDDFRRSPQSAYRQVLDFLGLPFDSRGEFPRYNQAMTFRSAWLTRSLRSRPLKTVSTVLKRSLSGRSYAMANRAKKTLMMRRQPRAELTDAFRSRLVAEFADDIRLLADRTGRDLSHWLQ